jgi:hypothetical protein
MMPQGPEALVCHMYPTTMPLRPTPSERAAPFLAQGEIALLHRTRTKGHRRAAFVYTYVLYGYPFEKVVGSDAYRVPEGPQHEPLRVERRRQLAHQRVHRLIHAGLDVAVCAVAQRPQLRIPGSDGTPHQLQRLQMRQGDPSGRHQRGNRRWSICIY